MTLPTFRIEVVIAPKLGLDGTNVQRIGRFIIYRIFKSETSNRQKEAVYLLLNQRSMRNEVVHSQFQYYLAHQDELVEKYNGKVIVLVNHEVVGLYETEREAYWDSVKKYQLGTFLIQLCTPGRDAYTIRAYPRYSAS